MPLTAFHDWLDPMAATLTYERFGGPEWIFPSPPFEQRSIRSSESFPGGPKLEQQQAQVRRVELKALVHKIQLRLAMGHQRI
jgi:hypothetical protein